MGHARTGAEFFLDALEQYGVPYLFGNPGTTELAVTKALEDSDVEYVLGLHEDVAVGMAAGYAKTRLYRYRDGADLLPVGVVTLHLEAGVAHGLGNLYGASAQGVPLVVTAGNHATDFRHEEPILRGDPASLASRFTKWSAEVGHVDALPTMLRRAVRVALTPPTGPVFLSLPTDVLDAETDAEPERLGAIPAAGPADSAQVEAAADALAAAEEPVLIAGDGVARAGTAAVDATVRLAEAAGARVHGEILSCEVNFPADHEQWGGYLPPVEATAAARMDADTLVFVGCSTNTTAARHESPLVQPEATCVHVGDDPWELGKNQPADVALLGDPRSVAEELADLVEERVDDATRRDRLRAVREAVTSESAGDGERSDGPGLSKAELVDGMRAVAPDAYLVDESVTSKAALLPRWSFAPGQRVSNKGAGLGYGLPFAVGAAMAERERPDPRPVVGFVGDGSYLYYPQALYSAARYGVDLTVVVPNNRNYRILKENMLSSFGGGEPDHEFVGLDIDPAVDLAASARSHGAAGTTVTEQDALEAELRAAMAAAGPSVLDVLVHD